MVDMDVLIVYTEAQSRVSLPPQTLLTSLNPSSLASTLCTTAGAAPPGYLPTRAVLTVLEGNGSVSAVEEGDGRTVGDVVAGGGVLGVRLEVPDDVVGGVEGSEEGWSPFLVASHVQAEETARALEAMTEELERAGEGRGREDGEEGGEEGGEGGEGGGWVWDEDAVEGVSSLEEAKVVMREMMRAYQRERARGVRDRGRVGAVGDVDGAEAEFAAVKEEFDALSASLEEDLRLEVAAQIQASSSLFLEQVRSTLGLQEQLFRQQHESFRQTVLSQLGSHSAALESRTERMEGVAERLRVDAERLMEGIGRSTAQYADLARLT